MADEASENQRDAEASFLLLLTASGAFSGTQVLVWGHLSIYSVSSKFPLLSSHLKMAGKEWGYAGSLPAQALPRAVGLTKRAWALVLGWAVGQAARHRWACGSTHQLPATEHLPPEAHNSHAGWYRGVQGTPQDRHDLRGPWTQTWPGSSQTLLISTSLSNAFVFSFKNF